MAYCENCGTKIIIDSNFCAECGVKIIEVDSSLSNTGKISSTNNDDEPITSVESDNDEKTLELDEESQKIITKAFNKIIILFALEKIGDLIVLVVQTVIAIGLIVAFIIFFPEIKYYLGSEEHFYQLVDQVKEWFRNLF